jgi:cellulose synthase/poly-beta-1,6-N-acetylglucosamine synthase-like glycosyltransferase
MKKIFIQYLKTKNKKKIKLHNAELNMAKRPQVV